eukprot:CAMPEP_0182876872 /NCGR_PEP_ID=MMETSP0034_2-20130328/14402_1 /TAXON_ID=156128 /ORGANISM="Nephroselmis pyriformis, Strain CCMP717" /LENGTH=118 /DNA_ID=CAMNT_0025009683 /DNA_START=118 /DNA_END=471 /DNA_ORIENTATION=+
MRNSDEAATPPPAPRVTGGGVVALGTAFPKHGPASQAVNGLPHPPGNGGLHRASSHHGDNDLGGYNSDGRAHLDTFVGDSDASSSGTSRSHAPAPQPPQGQKVVSLGTAPTKPGKASQ